MEAASELIINAAPRHFLKRGLRHGQQLLVLAFLVALENQLDRGSMRELRRLAESAVADVKKFGDRLDLRIHYAQVELGFCAVKGFRLRYRVSEGIGGTLEVRPLISIGIRDGQQNSAKTGPPALIVGRKIGAAIKGFAVRKQEAGQRPTALPGKGADGGLVARVDIRALVAIDFHGDEMLIDNLGDFGALVAFAVDHMAPMAPHRADIQEHGLVFSLGARKGGIAPFIPSDGLMGGRAQVRTHRILEPIFRLWRQANSPYCRKCW